MRNCLLILAVAGALSGCAKQRPEQVKKPDDTLKALSLPDKQETSKPDTKQPEENKPEATKLVMKNDEVVVNKDAKPQIPLNGWKLGYAEQKWHINIKKLEYIETTYHHGGDPITSRQYKFLMEFTKDLTADEMQVLRSLETRQHGVEFVLFDKDSVIQESLYNFFIEGKVTGVKGDAFRLILTLDRYQLGPQIVRAELRQRK